LAGDINEAAADLKLLLGKGLNPTIEIKGDELHVYIDQPNPGWITRDNWGGHPLKWHFKGE